VYVRRRDHNAKPLNAQQQAAAAWDAADRFRYEVTSVDGTDLDVDTDR
jgi:hypothetical protein